MSERPTPETDEMGSMRRTVAEWRGLCEKLERERDEAREQRDRLAAALESIAAVKGDKP